MLMEQEEHPSDDLVGSYLTYAGGGYDDGGCVEVLIFHVTVPLLLDLNLSLRKSGLIMVLKIRTQY
jgi:hypothetical protein